MLAVTAPTPRPLLGQRQERLKLEPSACLPRGYRVDDEAGVLQLVRERDGARLGVMATFDLACDYADAMVRIEAQRARMTEAAG